MTSWYTLTAGPTPTMKYNPLTRGLSSTQRYVLNYVPELLTTEFAFFKDWDTLSDNVRWRNQEGTWVVHKFVEFLDYVSNSDLDLLRVKVMLSTC